MVCQKYTNPIVSTINSPTYDLSLAELKPLIGKSGIHIINSRDFIQKIQSKKSDCILQTY